MMREKLLMVGIHFLIMDRQQCLFQFFAYAQGKGDDTNVSVDPWIYGGESGLKDQKVTIKKVTGMSENAMRGMDISSYEALKNAGVKYYDNDGNEESLLKVLHDNGVNYIRIRIWNEPI